MAAQTIDEYVSALPPAQADIISALRTVIRAAAPEASETFDAGRLTYAENGPIACVEAVEGGVQYGLWRGDEMPDPEGLLQPDEGHMKHVRFASVEDFKKKEMAYKYFVKIAVRLNHEKGDPTK